MTREEKIQAIYKEMANKELTPWCYVRIEPPYNGYGTFLYRLRGDESKEGIKEIIWHPIMIWDVIAYLRKDYDTFVEWKPEWDTRHYWNGKYYKALLDKIIYTWELFRKPIEDQSDECIDYVYSLIPKS